jgi:hypothetical protein
MPATLATGGARISPMEPVAAMLIVVFQFFFGWCDEESRAAQATPPAEVAADR